MLHVRLTDEDSVRLDAIVTARRDWAAGHGATVNRSSVIRLLIQREHAALQTEGWTP